MRARIVSLLLAAGVASIPLPSFAQNLREQFDATEYMIPMRDGAKLFTVVFVPKKPGRYPILMERTPYGAGSKADGPRRAYPQFVEEGYIFARQDVRGRNKSEGEYINIAPPARGSRKVDESTDTWDTCEFLLKNVQNFNGNIGLWGISYPGFYAGASAIGTHPALKAVSPQAPVSDWFLGDDVHHNGAFFLQETFDFATGFDVPRGGKAPVVDRQGKPAYRFFLDTGALPNFDRLHYKGLIPYWTDELMKHGTYDAYWKERSLPRNFKNVKCAVLTTGGWFDKEDMWGALNLYQYAERQNPGIPNFLVMGPWSHGQWAGGPGSSLGDISFGGPVSEYYREKVEFPFFEKYLRGVDVAAPAEATIFETGVNKWHKFFEWPPRGIQDFKLYLGEARTLQFAAPSRDGADSYVNDPANPTPYLWNWETSMRAPGDWLTYDQRYFSTRPDVLTYATAPLESDRQIVGHVVADLWITTTGTDCDLVVKVIDVYPDDTKDTYARDASKSMAGYQFMVRSDIFRAKFRNSFERPEPIVPGKPTRVRFALNDAMHTFRKGHRIMVQIQSSWFPIADRNPNKFMDIYSASDSDFQKATITLLRSPQYPSRVVLGTFEPK